MRKREVLPTCGRPMIPVFIRSRDDNRMSWENGSRGWLGEQIHDDESQQQDSTFDPGRPLVEIVKSHAREITRRNGINLRGKRCTYRVHTGNDAELRNQRER